MGNWIEHNGEIYNLDMMVSSQQIYDAVFLFDQRKTHELKFKGEHEARMFFNYRLKSILIKD